ncbi:hypothetical protein [Kineococcus sp. SYSU DK006]|uniref:hypothetical protein n=1 Tax=Kineococcus sp. SYSU DK006 TaxID=3383127 RepID=UPI003D7D6DBE
MNGEQERSGQEVVRLSVRADGTFSLASTLDAEQLGMLLGALADDVYEGRVDPSTWLP